MKKSPVTATAITSAATIDHQIPFNPQIMGKIMTAATWITSVRRKAMAADVSPSLRAVKNEEPKIANPENRNETENMEKACTVISNNSFSYPTNNKDSLSPNSSPAPHIAAEHTPINKRLFAKIFFTSPEFCAP